MVKTLKDHLIDTYDDLGEEKLKRFKGKLCDRNEEPQIRKNACERIKDSMDLADVMVDTFTSKGAVTVTIEILKAIGCNQQVVRLSEATGHTVARASSEVSQGSSSAPTNGPHFIDEHRVDLISRVNNVDAILDELLQKEIINQEEYNEIRCKGTSHQKMRELFLGPLNSAGNAGKVALYEALMKLQPMLMEDLRAQ